MTDSSIEQPGFDYFECPECEFSSVQLTSHVGSATCPLCAGDSGHDVLMRRRTARSDDVPEGRDARLVISLITEEPQ